MRAREPSSRCVPLSSCASPFGAEQRHPAVRCIPRGARRVMERGAWASEGTATSRSAPAPRRGSRTAVAPLSQLPRARSYAATTTTFPGPPGTDDLQEARVGREQPSLLGQAPHHASGRSAADHVDDDVPGRREDPVVLPERPDLRAHSIDVTGELLPEHASSRPEDPEAESHREPDPRGEDEPPQLAIGRADRRGADPDQHFVVLRDGLRHIPEPKDLGSAPASGSTPEARPIVVPSTHARKASGPLGPWRGKPGRGPGVGRQRWSIGTYGRSTMPV